MINIAVFASGNGSNAENLLNHFRNNDFGVVSCFLCNNKHAFVIERAKRLGVPCLIFDRNDFNSSNLIVDFLKKYHIDYIVLAGFLWLVPQKIVDLYPNRVVNIHPSLLPKHGGRGMYGDKVHQSVIADGDKESGITVHRVNGKYDDGSIIKQVKCAVLPNDTPEALAQRVHALEY